MERLQLPHPRPTSYRAIRCSRPTSRSAWLPPLPRKPVWLSWTLLWLLLCISIGALSSYYCKTSQRPKAITIPLVPLLEEATTSATVGVIVLASPLFHFILPTLPSKPGELPVLQDSVITPERLWQTIGEQVAGCRGASWSSSRRLPTPEEHRIFNMSSQYYAMYDELRGTMHTLWRDVYQPSSNLPASTFLNIVAPVRHIQVALDELNPNKGLDKFQTHLKYTFIGHIVQDMALAMQRHIQPVGDLVKALEESVEVLEECSQFLQHHCDFAEAEIDVRRNRRMAHHSRYMIKAWSFSLKNLVVASAHITNLSLELEKVINDQAYIGRPADLELRVGYLHAKLARWAMAHQKEMSEFHTMAEARERDDLTGESEDLGRGVGLRVDALGKPFLMPMWVWCRRNKHNCHTYWL